MSDNEIHLFIIWENARVLEKEIISDIKQNFDIICIHEITWTKEKFCANLTRLYGQNLPKHSHKEEHCGTGEFLLVIVCDTEPIYRIRKTSHGNETVNVNMFDSKEMYRSWTGGGHRIHGTNNIKEARHDLCLLTSEIYDDYIHKKHINGYVIRSKLKVDIHGSEQWESLLLLFKVLNETLDYVVLRNFEGLPYHYNLESHGDIDLLVDSFENAIRILNGEKVFKLNGRVQVNVNIAGQIVQFDLRHIGDNYYDKKWEEAILSNRVFDEKNFYKCDSKNYFYSLLYHCYIHKKHVADDYNKLLSGMLPEIAPTETDANFALLKKFLVDMDYKIVEPKDFSVYFNRNYTSSRLNITRIIKKGLNRVLSYKKVFKKIMHRGK